MAEDLAVEAAREYLAAGFAVVPIARGSKGPKHTGWPTTAADRGFPPESFAGMNVGVVLGAVSGDLADIDLDDSSAIALAPYFLPPTLTFGRASKRRSHWIYVCPGLRSHKYATSPDSLVEIRANNASGSGCGHQTVFPGSVHASGEAVEFDEDSSLVADADAGELAWAVQRLAFFSVVLAGWNDQRHEKSVAISGALLKAGWKPDEVRDGMYAVRCAANDTDAEHADFGHDVESSIKVFESGDIERLKGYGHIYTGDAFDRLNKLSVTPEEQLRLVSGISRYGSPRHFIKERLREATQTDRDAGALQAAEAIVLSSLGQVAAPAHAPTMPVPPEPAGGYTAETFDRFDIYIRRQVCDLKCKEGGKLEPLISSANVVNILTTDPRWASLCYDTFAHRILVQDPPMRALDAPDHDVSGEWTDSHTARLGTWLDEQYDLRVPPAMLDIAVNVAAEKRSFHPVRSYLDSLTWDGKPRVDGWLATYVGVEDSPYSRAVGAAFLLSMIARVRRPGCKVDTVLVFEGAQGARKSSALRVLAGDAWFTDSALDIRKKDGQEQIMGKWLVEWAELDNLARSELTAVKAFITEQVSRFRMAYGKRSKDYPRECVFAGTTNESNYLNDPTGNRRFWPVAVGAIDTEFLQRDRDQIWAEASARFAAGENWWLDADAEIVARVEQSEREATALDAWLPAFERYLALPVAPANAKVSAISAGFPAKTRRADITTEVMLTEVLAIPLADQDQRAASRAGRVLRKLGWRPKQKRLPSGGSTRVYEYAPDDVPDALAAQ